MAKIAMKRSVSDLPKGSVPIPGAQYNTRELQQQNFTGIQPVGNTLYGIPNQVGGNTANQTGGGTLPMGNVQTQGNPQADIFNTMLLDIFKQSQGVTAIDLLKKRRDLEKQQADAVSAPMPEGLSPGQQNSIISGRQAVTAADLSESDYEIARANKAVSNFEDLFYKASKFNEEFTAKLPIPEKMVQNYKLLIEADPDKMDTILSTLNDKSKIAVLGVLDYSKMKAKPKEKNVQVMGEYNDPVTGESRKKYGYFDDSGKIVYTDEGISSTKNLSDLLTPGTLGGQCGDYTHKIADNIPTMGNTWEEKMAIGNMSSMTYKVGDMLIQKTNLPAGHVSIVTSINGNQATVTESNYGLDEKVGTRTITMGDKSVTGIYRGGTLKTPKEQTSKFTPEFYRTTYGQKVLNNEQQYQTSFLGLPIVKSFIEVQNKAQSVRSIVESGISGPNDLALVFEFMKSLDPQSVVRESEYDTASKSGNPFKAVAAKMGGYVSKGQFLPEEVKQDFVKLSKLKLDVYQAQYNQVRDQFRKTAEDQGLNPEHVAPDLTVDWGSEKTIRVKLKSTGQTGTIPEGEFDSNLYDKI